jgi:hypothetical protein
MNRRSLSLIIGLAALGSLAFGQAPSGAGTTTKAVKTGTLPRTPDGRPDFQGVWVNNNATPLERPKELSGRATLTDAEVAAMKKKAHELFGGESDAAFGDSVFTAVFANINGTKSGFKSTDDGTGDYSSVWTIERDWNNRTSLVTDPPDGRIPPLTPEAQARQRANQAVNSHPPYGPEDRLLQERCITYGSPSLVEGYQSGYQIVQSSNMLAVTTEMIHDTRLIPIELSGASRPRIPSNIQEWLGDSRAHWEGDTLVVETTNYKPRAFRTISSDQLHVTERWTRTGPDVLKYEITINDPGTWTKPWSLMIPLKRVDHPLYEYACHEGNYGLAGILAGARKQEEDAASGSQPK